MKSILEIDSPGLSDLSLWNCTLIPHKLFVIRNRVMLKGRINSIVRFFSMSYKLDLTAGNEIHRLLIKTIF